MSDFLQKGYEVPKTGGHYMKFAQGSNKFRILGNAILGWEDWDANNKPVRTPFNEPKPSPLNADRSVKHFWAFPVWDYADKSVKILEITQSGIQNAIHALHNDPAWGSPFKYDITVTKKGEKLETEYTVMPAPPTELCEEGRTAWLEANIRLQALFEGGDPFEAPQGKEVDVEKIPF